MLITTLMHCLTNFCNKIVSQKNCFRLNTFPVTFQKKYLCLPL